MARTVLPVDHPLAPKYWQHETGGFLGPAVERYIKGEDLSPADIAWIRAYLYQWIDSPVWDSDDKKAMRRLMKLREDVARIETGAQIGRWLFDAVKLGIDPL